MILSLASMTVSDSLGMDNPPCSAADAFMRSLGKEGIRPKVFLMNWLNGLSSASSCDSVKGAYSSGYRHLAMMLAMAIIALQSLWTGEYCTRFRRVRIVVCTLSIRLSPLPS